MYVTSDGVQLRLSAKGSTAAVVKDASGHWQTGSSGNDKFFSASGDTDIGGGGDDSYYVWSARNLIVEAALAGVDTVFGTLWGSFTLPANVENLILAGGGMTWNTGNSLANIMAAGTAPSFLDGGAGNDVLVGGTGRDIFNVRRGYGSDVVERFDAGLDQVRVQNYGITSYAALQGMMSQSGADVLIRLPGAESVTLRDTRLSELTATDFVLANTSASQSVLGAIVPDLSGLVRLPGIANVALDQGWYAFGNCYGVGTMVAGRDFTLGTRYHPTDLTAGTIFDWAFPTIATGPSIAPHILAFPELIFGNAPKSGNPSDPGDTEHAFPVRVDTIGSLLVSHDLSFSGDTRGYNVSYDLWLSSTPNGGPGTITNEVMIWVHQGDFGAIGDYLGTYQDGAFSASVYHSAAGHVTSFVTNSDLPSATIDVGHILDFLQARGIVSGSEYFRDVELGAEVVSGKGSLTINDLTIVVATDDAGGSELTKTVTGTGTIVTHDFAGTAGADTLAGTLGNDVIEGGAGNDVIDGGRGGADRLDGGDGSDTASFASASAAVYVNLSLRGQPQNTGGAGVDTLWAIENLSGSAFADRLYGGFTANRISGGAGSDFINAGSDSDILTGGTGQDLLYGGNGADRFVYAAAGESPASAPDTIADFSGSAGDVIDLSGVDANVVVAGVQHFHYVGTGAFAAAGDLRIVYGAGMAQLLGDIDGDHLADFAIRLDGVDAGHPFAASHLILG